MAGRQGDMRDDSAKTFFLSFFFFLGGGSHREQFWHRQGRPPFDVVHRAFSLPTTVSPTLQKRIAALNLAIFPSFRLRSLTVTPAIEWFEPKRHIVSKTAYFQYKNTLVRHTPSVTVCLVG